VSSRVARQGISDRRNVSALLEESAETAVARSTYGQHSGCQNTVALRLSELAKE